MHYETCNAAYIEKLLNDHYEGPSAVDCALRDLAQNREQVSTDAIVQLLGYYQDRDNKGERFANDSRLFERAISLVEDRQNGANAVARIGQLALVDKPDHDNYPYAEKTISALKKIGGEEGLKALGASSFTIWAGDKALDAVRTLDLPDMPKVFSKAAARSDVATKIKGIHDLIDLAKQVNDGQFENVDIASVKAATKDLTHSVLDVHMILDHLNSKHTKDEAEPKKQVDHTIDGLLGAFHTAKSVDLISEKETIALTSILEVYWTNECLIRNAERKCLDAKHLQYDIS